MNLDAQPFGHSFAGIHDSAWRRLARGIGRTLRYWMETEVHVYAFSVAANLLLSFFPFLIVSLSLTRIFFDQQTTVRAIDTALRDFFPDTLGNFLRLNLPPRRPVELVSMILLFFTANGIFEPLEVALNRIWGIRKNRSFLRNQLVSLWLIFACGFLAILSLTISALQQGAQPGLPGERWFTALLFKAWALPLLALALFLIYRYLPNGRPPIHRLVPAAIIVGLMLEVLKYLNVLVWWWVDDRLRREYGVFRYSVTIIFQGFLATMLVLAGAEWAARGHQMSGKKQE